MRYLTKTRIIILLSASIPITALGQPASPAGITDEQLFGTAIQNSKWPTLRIPVCWENASQKDAPYRAITRQAVEDTWEKHSLVQFIGWNACTDNSIGIRIHISDEGPHVKALGKYLDKRPQGMVLNFTFNHWSPSCSARQDFCIAALAVHEFGHALGFTHEQNRPDAPAECHADSQGPTGDYLVTKYDPYSVMNYCNPIWNGDGRLSELDIKAVQKFYGAP
jgi:hypothetical protein